MAIEVAEKIEDSAERASVLSSIAKALEGVSWQIQEESMAMIRGCAIAIIALLASSKVVTAQENLEALDNCIGRGDDIIICLNQGDLLSSDTDIIPEALKDPFSRNLPSSGGGWQKTPADISLEQHSLQ